MRSGLGVQSPINGATTRRYIDWLAHLYQPPGENYPSHAIWLNPVACHPEHGEGSAAHTPDASHARNLTFRQIEPLDPL